MRFVINYLCVFFQQKTLIMPCLIVDKINYKSFRCVFEYVLTTVVASMVTDRHTHSDIQSSNTRAYALRVILYKRLQKSHYEWMISSTIGGMSLEYGSTRTLQISINMVLACVRSCKDNTNDTVYYKKSAGEEQAKPHAVVTNILS